MTIPKTIHEYLYKNKIKKKKKKKLSTYIRLYVSLNHLGSEKKNFGLAF